MPKFGQHHRAIGGTDDAVVIDAAAMRVEMLAFAKLDGVHLPLRIGELNALTIAQWAAARGGTNLRHDQPA